MMKSTNSGLQTLEYLFIAVSMVGIAIATFSEEITYAAIPLIITLLLNVFNRQQIEDNIVLLEKKLLEEKPEGEEEFSSDSYGETFKTIETKIEETQKAIAQLQQDFHQLSTSFNPNEFKSQLMDFQTTLTTWQNRLDSLNSVDLSPMEEEIRNLQGRLDSFAQVQSEIAQIQQSYQTLEGRVQDSKGEINHLLNLIQSLPSRSELEELKQNLDSLAQIKNEVNNLVNWQSFNELSSRLNDLGEQFNQRSEPETIRNLSNEVKSLSNSLSNLSEQFNQRSEPETIRNLSNEVKTLSNSFSNLDFNQFGEQIKKLREQFETIPQKDLVEALATQKDELTKIEEKINEVEEERLGNQSSMNPKTKQRILKPKPRRVRVNQRRR